MAAPQRSRRAGKALIARRNLVGLAAAQAAALILPRLSTAQRFTASSISQAAQDARREVGRLGPPSATRLMLVLEPLVARASSFLEEEMDAGHMRRHEPRLLLLAIYSTVVGMITEVEVLRALGEQPTPRSLVRRRQEILRLLRSALLVDGVAPDAPSQDGGAGGRGRTGRGGV